MKKAVLAAGAILALGLFWYVGPLRGQNPTTANNPPAASPPARTRIGILNLTYVVKNYNKYKLFQEEIKGIVEPFQKKDADLRQQLEGLRKQAAELPRGAAQTPQGEELERKARDIQRQLEDNGAEIKLRLGKRSDDEMKIIFMDITQAVQSYASSHDFEMVLHYNDAVTKEDFLSAQNIGRKLSTGALMPMYWQPSMDISMDVVNVLNYNIQNANLPSGGTGSVPPANGQR